MAIRGRSSFILVDVSSSRALPLLTQLSVGTFSLGHWLNQCRGAAGGPACQQAAGATLSFFTNCRALPTRSCTLPPIP